MLTPGSRLGAYEVVSSLGAGGMGEVYRARDTKLGRDVALKILPDTFANDPERLARFEREAKTLASLNHPNIAQIYGFEQSGATSALVMELVEGEDLSQRIARGAIPLDEALPIAQADRRGARSRARAGHHPSRSQAGQHQAARGRHGQGAGLRPGQSHGHRRGRPAPASGATITSPAMTMHGMILGTAAYMSPEQAKGKPLDKRADIWAFGCVLYEMLTGKRAFGGEDVTDTLAFVITKDVEWAALPGSTPPSVVRLLKRCLQKDRKRRLADIADARLELDEAPLDAGEGTAAASAAGTRRHAMMWTAAVVSVSALTGFAVWTLTRPSAPSPAPLQRLLVGVPATAPYVGEVGGVLAVSPDGSKIAYVARIDGKRMLYVRSLDQLEAQPIRGTEEASNPFFSPDGESIGFFTNPLTPDSRLKKVSLRGGPAVTLTAARVPSGGTWLADDSIIFATDPGTSGGRWQLFQVAAAGGAPRLLAAAEADAAESFAFPDALPGGKTILFSIGGSRPDFTTSRIAALSLATGKYHTVIDRGYHARFVPSGHIVYMLGSVLMAVPFDTEKLETSGPGVPVVEGIRGRSNTAEAGYGVSQTGVMVYAPGAMLGGGVLKPVWVDRDGRKEALAAPAREYQAVRISPDGTKVVLSANDQERDLWIWDFQRRALTRLTLDPGTDMSPVWTPDGRRLTFGSDRSKGAPNIYWQPSDGAKPAERLSESTNVQLPSAFSPDGSVLVLAERRPETATDLMMMTMGQGRRIVPLIQTPAAESSAAISPDGRWLAYHSDESGQPEVYVRPFPNVDGGRWQVSTGFSRNPVWARDGRELFFVSGGAAAALRVIAVSVETGNTFQAGPPRAVLEGRYTIQTGHTFDVSLDGRRFLMLEEVLPPEPLSTSEAPFVVMLNWLDELTRLAPAR